MLGNPPKSRDELLATPLRELDGCWVGVRCGGACHRGSCYLPLKLMAAKHGGWRTLSDVIARLGCRFCQTAPASMWLVDYPIETGDHGGRTATWRVDLKVAAADSGEAQTAEPTRSGFLRDVSDDGDILSR